MGAFLHGSAKTTHAMRAELQRSQASVASFARKSAPCGKRFEISARSLERSKATENARNVTTSPLRDS